MFQKFDIIINRQPNNQKIKFSASNYKSKTYIMSSSSSINTQFLDHLKSPSISPFIKGKSKSGCGGRAGLASVFPIIFILYLNDLLSEAFLSK